MVLIIADKVYPGTGLTERIIPQNNNSNKYKRESKPVRKFVWQPSIY